MEKKVKVIVTIGPATDSEVALRSIKDKGVDFVRVNMSHSSLDYLRKIIAITKKVSIPFVIDTEGSQVRTGELSTPTIKIEENEEIRISQTEIIGNRQKINLIPLSIVSQLEVGDLIHVDFDTVTLRVSDVSTMIQGYLTAKAITGGSIGQNKAVIIDKVSNTKITLPTLSEKDHQSLLIGIEQGIGHIAASFIRSGKAVDEVRQATQNTMKIISKIECLEGLENLDEIIKKSDYLLIDRGDLSKEIPIEKIPLTQKIIIHKARKYGVGVFVASNLLESMIVSKKPTRAEVNDIINTIVDGAAGLALAAETAIGKYPSACINMLNNLIKHAQLVKIEEFHGQEEDKLGENRLVEKLEKNNYLLDFNLFSALIPPHGGKLVERMSKEKPWPEYLRSLPTITLDENRQRDVEQIAIGTYSPIEGFMGKDDFQSVLDRMRLANGIVWPLPIILDVSEEKAATLPLGNDIALGNEQEEIMAILHLEEKYTFDKKEMVHKLYTTDNPEHPGVQMVMKMHPVLLGGKITLLQRMRNEFKEYEFTPKQARRLFEERGWAKVVGFHTRNVIHRSHEFIQLQAMERGNCDGLFVHPIVGKKKTGDFNAQYIIKAYEMMNNQFYPKNRVLFGTFSSYSRYAGPREALFTALCRQNFGCSHFIVGRDHTGVGNFYHPKASHNIFDRFPELGIKAIKFNNIFYSPKLNSHIEEDEESSIPDQEKLHLSGTQARKLLEQGQLPPDWFMRPEIAQMIVEAMKKGEEVLVR